MIIFKMQKFLKKYYYTNKIHKQCFMYSSTCTTLPAVIYNFQCGHIINYTKPVYYKNITNNIENILNICMYDNIVEVNKVFNILPTVVYKYNEVCLDDITSDDDLSYNFNTNFKLQYKYGQLLVINTYPDENICIYRKHVEKYIDIFYTGTVLTNEFDLYKYTYERGVFFLKKAPICGIRDYALSFTEDYPIILQAFYYSKRINIYRSSLLFSLKLHILMYEYNKNIYAYSNVIGTWYNFKFNNMYLNFALLQNKKVNIYKNILFESKLYLNIIKDKNNTLENIEFTNLLSSNVANEVLDILKCYNFNNWSDIDIDTIILIDDYYVCNVFYNKTYFFNKNLFYYNIDLYNNYYLNNFENFNDTIEIENYYDVYNIFSKNNYEHIKTTYQPIIKDSSISDEKKFKFSSTQYKTININTQWFLDETPQLLFLELSLGSFDCYEYNMAIVAKNINANVRLEMKKELYNSICTYCKLDNITKITTIPINIEYTILCKILKNIVVVLDDNINTSTNENFKDIISQNQNRYYHIIANLYD